jgi:hypothetical protein
MTRWRVDVEHRCYVWCRARAQGRWPHMKRGLEAMPVAEYEAVVRQRDEALGALKETDSWLWNKVVNGVYGPTGDGL